MAEFKIGDVVQLKSGGPTMTVSHRSGSGQYECSWFNQNGGSFEIKWHSFPSDVLKSVRSILD